MRDPERLDLPSASSFEIVVECPGQPNLLREVADKLPKREEEEEEDGIRESGTRIHAARETGITMDLSEEELNTYKAGRGYEETLVAEWAANHQLSQWEERTREERMWLHDPTTGKPCLSAKLDAHYLSVRDLSGQDVASNAIVVDWKTGWSWKLTPSQRNWQLRVQAVLTWREYNGIKNVRVAFVKPIAKYDRLDFTDYTEDDLRQAEQLIYFHLWHSKQPDAPRRPGTHCTYCPCKAFCKEAAAYAMLPSIIDLPSGEAMTVATGITKATVAGLVDQMSLWNLKLVHARAGLVTNILSAVKSRLKKLDDATLASIGLKREQGRKLYPIVDTKGVFDFLKEFGISEDEIWKALKFSTGELVDALRRDQGWAAAAADGFVKGQLAPFIEEKRADDSIGIK